jgi:hypothetical protein
MKAKKTVKKVVKVDKKIDEAVVKLAEAAVHAIDNEIVKEVKPVEPKEKVYTEEEKQRIKASNMDEYIRLFGKE